LAEQQQAIYAVAGVNESEPAVAVKTKRKKIYTSNEGAEDVSALYPRVYDLGDWQLTCTGTSSQEEAACWGQGRQEGAQKEHSCLRHQLAT